MGTHAAKVKVPWIYEQPSEQPDDNKQQQTTIGDTMTTEASSATTIVKMIVSAESMYQTARQKRLACMAKLSAMNVAFPDIHKRLLKEAREEGFYSTDEELKTAKETKRDWVVQIHQFTDWVYRTYSNYDTPFKTEKDVVKKGATAPKVIKVSDGKLSDKRVEKILEVPTNIEVLSKGLNEKGMLIVPKKLGTKDIESILADAENVDALIEAMQERGLI